MKKTTLCIAALLCAIAAHAQNASSSAVQQIRCQLNDVVGVGMAGGNNGGGNGSGGSSVEMPLNGTTAMGSGIESPEFKVNLFSNANFDVSVQASSNAFTYTGAATSGTNMPVKDVLSVIITDNNTGGDVTNGYNNYQSVNGTTGKRVIGNGQIGTSSFGFKYKANPGFNYPAGTYTTDILYTITKH